MLDLVLVPVAGGGVALTHRPKLKDLVVLRSLGVTHVVTLLSEREGASSIGAATQRAGLAWVWCPLDNADPPSPERTRELQTVLADLGAAITAGGQVVIHCSAGIHRTGMFGYALLRTLGLGSDEARRRLAELRTLTAEGVGADRLAWGDALARSEVNSVA